MAALALAVVGLAACTPGSHTSVTPGSAAVSTTVAASVAASPPAAGPLAADQAPSTSPIASNPSALPSSAAQSSALAEVNRALASLNAAVGQAGTDLSAGDSARAQNDNG
jgi:hypothetical protein